jgi:hypothetical protein
MDEQEINDLINDLDRDDESFQLLDEEDFEILKGDGEEQ